MLFLTFVLGIILNSIGYIPPGNINLTVVQITINRGIRQALYFIAAFSAVEVLFTFAVMRFVQWLSSTMNLSNIIDVVMVVMFGVLGIITWKSRKEMPKADYSEKDSIRYGMLLGVLNPMQIPYWLFVGTYLISHEWIDIGYLSLSVFSVGSGIGAGLALYGFARFAKYIKEKFDLSSYIVNKSIAILFFALSGYHICKIVYVHFIKV
ncbi:LysE family transporter [Pedobacter nutrimenti]|jgi:threonine/homoserine/homoserine lactone efflux protein|uniref:Threonine/homoserine/homoserine lactone efflux protein n=1 Tax=Pedobacter nutrimenti TaxID=1241337 RepID=A0A318UG83_9SPHI|nr:LysE family transporter [Pedobacter nutrimenti]PYF74500.1 threonine/homoserine/homoserine lactone efflux protein [Pedobacter nutrimenti]